MLLYPHHHYHQSACTEHLPHARHVVYIISFNVNNNTLWSRYYYYSILQMKKLRFREDRLLARRLKPGSDHWPLEVWLLHLIPNFFIIPNSLSLTKFSPDRGALIPLKWHLRAGLLLTWWAPRWGYGTTVRQEVEGALSSSAGTESEIGERWSWVPAEGLEQMS